MRKYSTLASLPRLLIWLLLGKSLRRLAQAESLKNVVFSSAKEDRIDAWSWNVDRDWHPSPGNDYINAFIVSYHEVKTWEEVFVEKTVGKHESVKKKHVYYPVTSITREARKRLVDIEMDDHDHIFRFRMSNQERLYGFIVGATFITVWYDPTHKIYPVD